MFKKTIFTFGVLFISTPVFAFSADNFFFDIPPDHPYLPAITALRNDGIIDGFADNTFHPDQPVIRAEALKIILLGSDIPEPDTPAQNPFPDVDKEEWFATFVLQAKAKGIIQGTEGGDFEPDRTVYQSEALKMILLTNEISVSAPDRNPFDNISKDEWYAPYYREAQLRQLLPTGEVDPGKELTRGDLVQIMYRFIRGAKTYSYPIGVISYYGDSFTGRQTSSGEAFDNNAFTAAHRTLDFGTRLLVRDLESGGAVVVSVNDRGPYVAFRHLDLSKSAFSALQPPSRGLTRGEMQVVDSATPLGPVEKLCTLSEERKLIPKDAFSGITLDAEIPLLFRRNEIFTIRGSAPEATDITVFWGEESHRKQLYTPVTNGKFEIAVPFLESGNFDLGILPDRSGTANVYPIQVADGLCLVGTGEQPPAVTNIRSEIRNGKYRLLWDVPASDIPENENGFFRVLFSQQEKTLEFFVHGAEELTPPPALFADFRSGPAEVRIFSAELSSAFSADISTPFSGATETNLILSQHFFSEIDPGKLQRQNFSETFRFGQDVVFSGDFYGAIKDSASLILPDGNVEETDLITKGQTFTLRFRPEHVGTHIVEINSEDGFALINAPIYPEGFAPLLPDYFDLHSRGEMEELKEINPTRDRLLLLNLINAARAKYGLTSLSLQEGSNALAQFRVDDMAERKYFAHNTPEGKQVNDFALDFGVRAIVSENIAIDLNLESLHEGFMRSAIHRENILNPKWKYVGLGITKDLSGGIIVAELFSEEPLENSKRDLYKSQILEVINERREDTLAVEKTLFALGDTWAEKMSKEDFFAVKSPSDETLQGLLAEYGFHDSVMISLYQYASFSEFLDILAERDDSPFLFDPKWNEVGLGIYVDEVGIMSVVVMLTE